MNIITIVVVGAGAALALAALRRRPYTPVPDRGPASAPTGDGGVPMDTSSGTPVATDPGFAALLAQTPPARATTLGYPTRYVVVRVGSDTTPYIGTYEQVDEIYLYGNAWWVLRPVS